MELLKAESLPEDSSIPPPLDDVPLHCAPLTGTLLDLATENLNSFILSLSLKVSDSGAFGSRASGMTSTPYTATEGYPTKEQGSRLAQQTPLGPIPTM